MYLKNANRVTGLLIAVFLSACMTHPGKTLLVDVNLLHMPSSVSKAYLEEMLPLETRLLDTAVADPLKGTFQFHVYTTNGSEGLYRIRLQDSTIFLLALKDRDVKVSGDYTHLDQLKIQGSPASEELQHFLVTLRRENNKLHHLTTHRDTLLLQHASDSMLMLVSSQIDHQNTLLLDTILHVARTSQSPVNAVFALSLLDTKQAWEEGKGIFSGLAQRFPHNDLIGHAVDAFDKKMNDQGLNAPIDTGDIAPDLRYPNPEGQMIALKDFRGKYVLLDFWASWCAPCREQNPQVLKAWETLKDRNLALLGVSLDTKKESWKKAIAADQLPWPQISDLKGWNSVPAAVYGVEAIPANFLIDPAGKVIAVNIEADSLVRTLRLLVH